MSDRRAEDLYRIYERDYREPQMVATLALTHAVLEVHETLYNLYKLEKERSDGSEVEL